MYTFLFALSFVSILCIRFLSPPPSSCFMRADFEFLLTIKNINCYKMRREGIFDAYLSIAFYMLYVSIFNFSNKICLIGMEVYARDQFQTMHSMSGAFFRYMRPPIKQELTCLWVDVDQPNPKKPWYDFTIITTVISRKCTASIVQFCRLCREREW